MSLRKVLTAAALAIAGSAATASLAWTPDAKPTRGEVAAVVGFAAPRGAVADAATETVSRAESHPGAHLALDGGAVTRPARPRSGGSI